MRCVFNAWLRRTSQVLQDTAAVAAMEAAAAYHTSRLTVRTWRAWRRHVQQVCWLWAFRDNSWQFATSLLYVTG